MTALDGYFLEGNLPRIMVFGQLEDTKVLNDVYLQERELDDIHRKAVMLLQSLLGGSVTDIAKSGCFLSDRKRC